MADNLLSSFLPDDRAAFGVFPQMKPKRRLQDVQGSANVPLDVTRGRVAGLAGLLPDVLNFMGRSPMPTEQFGETQYEPAQQLPYGSEYFLQNLPLKPTSRIGEVAGQAGAFVPLNPMPAARAVAAGARALGPTAVRMGEGYLQRQGLMPTVVPEAPGTPATPLSSMIEKPQAPVSPIGFYSAAEQAALALPRKSGTGDAFLNDLMKGQDVKKDELSWMGLDDYLKGKPNVTRQEVQDYIAGNRVDVQEVRLGEPLNINKLSNEQLDAEYQRMFGESLRSGYGPDWRTRRQDIIDELTNPELENGISGATKYQQYQLPGGENYREILLTLPEKAPAMYPNFDLYFQAKFSDYADPSNPLYAMAQKEAKRNWDATGGKIEVDDFSGNKVGLSTGNYTSSHFDQPNILAHMRVNDRIDADGKKMLLIEEVQSDWHQAGREKGYKTKARKVTEEQKQEFKKLNAIDDGDRTGQMNERLDELESLIAGESQGVPDAPFKGTWHQLALKRALKYAADNGYDRVGLTTGRQQAERYQLSKQISEVHYSGTNFKAYDLDGNEVISRTGVKPEEIAGLIGKEPAKKLLEQPKQGTLQSLTGQNLDVGGEGMKKYYDEIYPAFLEKQGKKYNAKTGETTIGKKGTIEKAGTSYYQTPDTKATVRYIDISPEMRGGVKKGQPLFTAAPIGGIGLGAGTQDQQQNSINSFIQ